MKCIFWYLKSIVDIGLVHYRDTSYALTGYSDYDYATYLDGRIFMIGYAFTIGNSLANCKATILLTFALSTTRAEYMALVEATKQGILLKGLISNQGFPKEKAIIFYVSLSAMCLAKDQVHHERTIHIDIIYHFIHTEQRVKGQKFDTRENPANMLTKHIPIRKGSNTSPRILCVTLSTKS